MQLRSGRMLGDDKGPIHFIEHPSLPENPPPSSRFLIFPMRVGRASFTIPETHPFYAIVGYTMVCTGQGATMLETADDACVNLADYAIGLPRKQLCPRRDDNMGFGFEQQLRRECGLEWDPTLCVAFLLLDQGEVKSFGWQKKGDKTWRIWKTPEFISLK